ncbi:hypothetical protein T492DRAFT_1126378 [Pavlovales sp. CCMP2436]|nr:hypothetical protein T492DRAFT_1126378 [Pavlovales sp. CCMP2436]
MLKKKSAKALTDFLCTRLCCAHKLVAAAELLCTTGQSMSTLRRPPPVHGASPSTGAQHGPTGSEAANMNGAGGQAALKSIHEGDEHLASPAQRKAQEDNTIKIKTVPEGEGGFDDDSSNEDDDCNGTKNRAKASSAGTLNRQQQLQIAYPARSLLSPLLRPSFLLPAQSAPAKNGSAPGRAQQPRALFSDGQDQLARAGEHAIPVSTMPSPASVVPHDQPQQQLGNGRRTLIPSATEFDMNQDDPSSIQAANPEQSRPLLDASPAAYGGGYKPTPSSEVPSSPATGGAYDDCFAATPLSPSPAPSPIAAHRVARRTELHHVVNGGNTTNTSELSALFDEIAPAVQADVDLYQEFEQGLYTRTHSILLQMNNAVNDECAAFRKLSHAREEMLWKQDKKRRIIVIAKQARDAVATIIGESPPWGEGEGDAQ